VVRVREHRKILEQVALLRDEQDGMMEGMEENNKAVAALRQKVDAEIKDHKQGTEKQLNLMRTGRMCSR